MLIRKFNTSFKCNKQKLTLARFWRMMATNSLESRISMRIEADHMVLFVRLVEVHFQWELRANRWMSPNDEWMEPTRRLLLRCVWMVRLKIGYLYFNSGVKKRTRLDASFWSYLFGNLISYNYKIDQLTLLSDTL